MAAASGVSGRLGAKLGPLPVWGWAVLAVGLYVGYRLLAGGSGGSDSPAPVGVSYPTNTPVTSGGSVDSGSGSSGLGSVPDNLSGDYLDAYGQLVDAYGGINSALLGGLLAGEQSVIQQSEVNGGVVSQLLGTLTDVTAAAIAQPAAYLDILRGGYGTPGTAPAIPAGLTQPAAPSLVESAGYAVAPAAKNDGGAAGNDATGWADYPILHFPPVSSPPAAASQTAAKAASSPKPKTTTSGGVTTVQTNAGPYGKKPLQ